MRYAIDLGEGRKASRWRYRINGERLLEVLTSNWVFIALISTVVLAVAYFLAMDLVRGMAPEQKAKVKELRLIQGAVAKEKESMIEQAKVLLTLKSQSPGWAEKLRTIGHGLPEGIWLTKIALQEPQARKGGQPGQQQQWAGKMLILVEGRVDTRSFASVLEPITLLVSRLKSDQEFSSLVPDLELASLQATKEDPMVVAFQVKGTWDWEKGKEKTEERIREELKRAGL